MGRRVSRWAGGQVGRWAGGQVRREGRWASGWAPGILLRSRFQPSTVPSFQAEFQAKHSCMNLMVVCGSRECAHPTGFMGLVARAVCVLQCDAGWVGDWVGVGQMHGECVCEIQPRPRAPITSDTHGHRSPATYTSSAHEGHPRAASRTAASTHSSIHHAQHPRAASTRSIHTQHPQEAYMSSVTSSVHEQAFTSTC